MKKLLFFCTCLLLMTACTSEDGNEQQEYPFGNALLWGKWKFSYVTNTMTGTRSYTFSSDGHYVYLDEWTINTIDGPSGPTQSTTQEGNFSVSNYTLTNNKSAEGDILIGDKELHFTITTTDYDIIYLNLIGDECYEKE